MGVDGRGASPLSALPPRFGKYTILGHLATGGMAEVYLARAEGIEGFEKIVVIKRIRPDLSGDRSTTRMFLHEARLAATLEHPNIAHVHEIDIVQGNYFFVMEYVHGADLRQLMDAAHRKGWKVSLADAINIIIHVCAALHYAHEKRDQDDNPLGIIHRDVSPSNVLISHDGAVKVCDFGIAKVTARSGDTQRGVVKGKFSYMAPEQCLAEPVDRRTDIFVIGVLLYELSTLTRLFEANADFELMRKIVQDPVESPSKRAGPDYPPELERIVLKALSRKPEDRYPTAQMMQLELEAFARERKLATSSVGLARLMSDLFEKKVRAWRKADQDGIGLGEHLLEQTQVPDSGESYLPVITTEPSGEVETARGFERTPREEAETASSRSPSRTVGRRSPGWLVGALIAALASGGALLGEMSLSRSRADAARLALADDAVRIADAIDAEIRAVHLRADAIATNPMLRAAIATDAATMRDMALSERVFSPGPGEVVEIFQQREALVSMLRIPSSGRALEPLAGHETRLERADGRLAVAVGASIAELGAATVGGALTLSVLVELTPLRRTLDQHAVAASLTGLDQPIPLVGDGSAAGALSVPLPTSPDWKIAPLALAAAPRLARAPVWIFALEIACGVGALAMLAAYVVRRRRPRGNQ